MVNRIAQALEAGDCALALGFVRGLDPHLDDLSVKIIF